ncbi:MAG: hypothetical protein IJV64_05415, partial [Oscillospiraceae bacterium]|nr:hypothetical protein [Oscillospiraceae bacterium]
ANTVSVTDPVTGETNTLEASITGNTATSGNGGAIYSASGAVTISGGTFSGNKATNTANGLGGAVYAGSGNVTYSGGTITTNEAVNGAALYVGSGVANITASITENTPSSENGGAIGVGSADARLQFSGGAHVYNNTITIKVNNKDTRVQRNVCLNVDSESVIVATGVTNGKMIGIYVPGGESSELVIKRGDIGGYFGAYTSESNVDSVFKNDRFPTVVARHQNDRLYWSSQLVYDVIYREASTSTEPPTAGDSYNNTNSYKTIAINKGYYPHAVDNNIYDLVMEMGLYKAYTSQFATAAGNATKAATSVYAYTYADKANNSKFESGLTFDDYLTKVTWDRSTHKWKFEKRDGTVITDKDRIVIIYAAPAYLTIVNNTDPALNLKLTNLTVLERDEAGSGHYGFVTARNGATAETLNPIVPSDLELSSGDSVKLLFPGAAGQSFTLSGTFTGNNVETATVKYTITGQAEKTLTATSQTADGLIFTLPANECTLTSDATTKEVRFGSPLPICKIGNETFPTLMKAMEYAQTQKTLTGNKAYTIEMMVDYLQPNGDRLIIPDGFDITVTTAAKTGSNPYTGNGDRATLSRDVGNTGGPMIDSNNGTYSDGAYVSSLKVTNLIFDGRDLGGTGNGGAVRAKNMPVKIDNCQFKGFQATNGGAVYIDYDTGSAAARTVYYAH